MSVRILLGDVRDKLAELADESVHCVVTSPPYFGLRDYGIDGQIGLEATPEAFVAVMVEVFREVRRVLRSDGTLWLNLGDSYTSGGRATWRSGASENKGQDVLNDMPRPAQPDGLKQKDLIGIPWRVAFALQQPYYTGRIKSEADRIWLAAMIDGEGCMFIHKRKAGTENHSAYTKKDGSISRYDRTQDNYGSGLEIANTHESIVQRCLAITGRGSICRQDKDRRQPLFRWNLRSNECCEVVREIYPHLVGKQHQARLLFGCPSSGKDADAAHTSLMALHNGQPATIDFPAPPTMFEPGWYLRQDLIWSKLNPMPESVTDRCTKSHEYLFLLSKSARYHYDAEAIKEENSPGSIERFGLTDEGQTRTWNTSNNKRDGRTDGTKSSEAFRDHVPIGRNRRSVWTVATQPFKEAHFATFPPDLIEPCIKAGCPKDCCAKCGAPVVRVIKKTYEGAVSSSGNYAPDPNKGHLGNLGERSANMTRDGFIPNRSPIVTDMGTQPTCKCNAGLARGTVLDPFGGAGTTGLVADRLQRDAILIELNGAYMKLASDRITDDAPLFAKVVP